MFTIQNKMHSCHSFRSIQNDSKEDLGVVRISKSSAEIEETSQWANTVRKEPQTGSDETKY